MNRRREEGNAEKGKGADPQERDLFIAAARNRGAALRQCRAVALWIRDAALRGCHIEPAVPCTAHCSAPLRHCSLDTIEN